MDGAMTRRKLCVVTGTRAEYGLLYWLMKEIAGDPGLALQLIVTGTHLSPFHGMTVDAILADGFAVDARVDMLLAADTPSAVAKSMALCTIGMAEAFDRLNPDCTILLGDRYELLAAAQAAMLARIPIAHIHGGEATEGLIDEAIRHAVTKMAHLHFVTAEPYGRRVAQMGEDPARIFMVGAPGLDYIRRTPPMSRPELASSLGLRLDRRLFLVTYHPVTLSDADPGKAMQALLQSLGDYPDAEVVITGTNADPGNQSIAAVIDRWVAKAAGRAISTPSLGQRRYLSLMGLADAVVGNSSSGIIEAPAVGTPTVNIGERQRGRLRAASVVDCGESVAEIRAALATALDPAFRASLAGMRSPYGEGGAAERMVAVLRDADLSGILFKRFHDQ
jgi:UDP-N-acetylglucosamine 2-epimerase (non-hydrolysing)